MFDFFLIDLVCSLICCCLNGANCVHGRIQILQRRQRRDSPLELTLNGHLSRNGLLIDGLVDLLMFYNFLCASVLCWRLPPKQVKILLHAWHVSYMNCVLRHHVDELRLIKLVVLDLLTQELICELI